jgi:hypothetical protein
MLSEFSPDICPWTDIAVALRCLRLGKIDVITENSDNMISSLFINRTMHAFFHIRTVIIPQPISITHSLVCVCEVNFVPFQQISVLGKIDCLHFLQDFKWCSCFPKTC